MTDVVVVTVGQDGQSYPTDGSPWQAGVMLDPAHMDDIKASTVGQQAMGAGGGRTADVRD